MIIFIFLATILAIILHWVPKKLKKFVLFWIQSNITFKLIKKKNKAFKDNRGFYWTSWKKGSIKKIKFKHDKFSLSKKNVLRGLHGDSETWKLVSCPYGKFLLVVVNCQKKSKDYLRNFITFTIRYTLINNRLQTLNDQDLILLARKTLREEIKYNFYHARCHGKIENFNKTFLCDEIIGKIQDNNLILYI